MSSKIKKIVIVTIALFLTVLIGLNISVSNSDAYEKTIKYLASNKVVKSKLGNGANYSLSFFGYSIQTSGVSGRAEFKINSSGELGDGEVFISLKKTLGIWAVMKANMILPTGEIIKNI